jgi:hypothetical protein
MERAVERGLARRKIDQLQTVGLDEKSFGVGQTYPITNAVTEGLNSKIQQLKAHARGFRSFLNYRTRILFFCGKLDLLPKVPGLHFAQ